MQQRILEFAGILRKNGVRVSTAETIEALQAAELAGIRRRNDLKNALRATMVKRSVDIETFDDLFDLFFSGLGEMIRSVAAQGRATADLSDAQLQDFLDSLSDLIDELAPEMSELARALLLQDTGTLERILREMMQSDAVRSIDPNSPPAAMTRALAALLGADGVAEELDAFADAAAQAGIDQELLDRIREYLEQRMQDLGSLLRGAVDIDRAQREHKEERERQRDRLLDKSFYYLSPTEIKQMREAVTALARRLKNLMSIRRKRTKRGRLDVKATLRDSLEFGGVPFRIRYENKRKERPQVVILCDISDSVRNVSRFMLQFVHSLQDLYSKVRSYVFVADIAEVTKLFSDNDIQTAINEAIAGNVVNVYAHSDFGKAFRIFHRDHIEAIDSRTTVIILGDARNNYNAANEWVLRDIQQRARQVIWLNPENRSTWGFGDSEMAKYAKYCDMVEECRNLRQLYRVVDMLVPA